MIYYLYFWLVFIFISFLSIIIKIVKDSILAEPEPGPDNLASRVVVPEHDAPEPKEVKRRHKKPIGTSVLAEDRVAELKQMEMQTMKKLRRK